MVVVCHNGVAHSKYLDSNWVDADTERLQSAGMKAYRLPNSYKNLDIYRINISGKSSNLSEIDESVTIIDMNRMAESEIQSLSTETLF